MSVEYFLKRNPTVARITIGLHWLLWSQQNQRFEIYTIRNPQKSRRGELDAHFETFEVAVEALEKVTGRI